MAIYNRTFNLVIKNLRSCYYPNGIVAGRHHFTDYWARDGFFASLGSMAIGDFEIVNKMVELFFSYQRYDGLIPYRVMNGPMISLQKYLMGKPPKYSLPKPTYRLRGFGQNIYDGTTLCVLVAAELGIMNKLKKNFINESVRALNYLETREKQGLLWDGPMAEWHDSIYKFGNLLYSNVIYWKSLKRLGDYLKKINDDRAGWFDTKQKSVAKSIRKRLWNGKFFADWYDYKRQDYFYPYGNLLAVLWGLTTPHESESILEEAGKLWFGFTLETNVPKYPWWRVDFLNHLIGMGDYQNQGVLWLQPGILYAAALAKVGRLKKSEAFLKLISDQILKFGGVYEAYERNGKPIQRIIYKSEQPFAWSAGLFLWANKIIEGK
jgi:hypothetical protein